MKINNLTVEQYFTLNDTSEYDVFLDILKPVNLFCNNTCNIKAITYNEFKVAQKIFNNPTIENLKDLFLLLFRVKGNMQKSAERMFFEESVFVFFRAKKFLHNYLEYWIDTERNGLASTPDIRMLEIKAAEMLSPYETILTKIQLGEQFGIDPEEIGNWKYTKVFNILLTNNAVREVTNKYYAK